MYAEQIFLLNQKLADTNNKAKKLYTNVNHQSKISGNYFTTGETTDLRSTILLAEDIKNNLVVIQYLLNKLTKSENDIHLENCDQIKIAIFEVTKSIKLLNSNEVKNHRLIKKSKNLLCHIKTKYRKFCECK
jgi:hypothetical protein